MIRVNGKSCDGAGKTVSQMLKEQEYDLNMIARIAVERNGEIVFKSQYDETILEDGDSIEVVTFMSGG